MICNSYYGGFRTRTFADIFPSEEVFSNKYQELPFEKNITDSKTVYYLLYARYGNSHIAFSDENQFVYSIFSYIYMYGPAWEKRIDIQKILRDIPEEELMLGSKAIYNHSFNPSTEPSTSSLEELTTINDQNTTHYKRSKLEAYANLWVLLRTDVTEEFITRFKKLFLTVVAADFPLLYATEEENDGSIDEDNT